MTYCLGISVNNGIVLATDSRTNAGVDNISTVSKMHVFAPAPDRVFVLLSAGNLATTQEVIDHLHRDLNTGAVRNFNTCHYLFEAAEYVGQISQEVQTSHSQALALSGVSGEATFILGGQIAGQAHGLFLIYPQGNYISASEDTPFLQIGEAKYGKPVLERILDMDISLPDCARLALISLDSTARSNLSVGPPYEISIIPKDLCRISHQFKYQKNSEELRMIRKFWHNGIRDLFFQAPRFQWELMEQNQLQQPAYTQQQPSQGFNTLLGEQQAAQSTFNNQQPS